MTDKNVYYDGDTTRHPDLKVIIRKGKNTFTKEIADRLIYLGLVTPWKKEEKQEKKVKNYENKMVTSSENKDVTKIKNDRS